MVKERTYAILTSDSWRIEVKANSVRQAYKRANEKLVGYKNNPEMRAKGMIADNSELTSGYMTFGRSGINTAGWISNNDSRKYAKASALKALYGNVYYGKKKLKKVF